MILLEKHILNVDFYVFVDSGTKKKWMPEIESDSGSQSLVHFSKMLTWILRRHNLRSHRGRPHLDAKQKSEGICSLVQKLGQLE